MCKVKHIIDSITYFFPIELSLSFGGEHNRHFLTAGVTWKWPEIQLATVQQSARLRISIARVLSGETGVRWDTKASIHRDPDNAIQRSPGPAPTPVCPRHRQDE